MFSVQHYQNKVVVSNTINKAGYYADICYFGQKDTDVKLLLNKINDLDDRYFFNLVFESKISFTGDIAKQLLKLIETRKITVFIIENQCLDKEQAKVILSFLNSPHVNDLQYL